MGVGCKQAMNLQNGVSVRTSFFYSFYSRVAMWTKTNEVVQPISPLPIIVKFTPRRFVMNVKRFSKFIFGYATRLAFITIPFARFTALCAPVCSTPLDMTTLPVGMIWPLLPSHGARIGTELARIFRAFGKTFTNVNCFTTLLASQLDPTSLGLTFHATKSNIVLVSPCLPDLKFFATCFASNRNSIFSTKCLALNRTIEFAISLLIAICSKFFSAVGTVVSFYSHIDIIPQFYAVGNKVCRYEL